MARILVVDDIKDNITLLRFNLEDEGHQVLTASSGRECLEKAITNLPDLILLDMMMPGMDGMETLEQLKNSDILNAIPVVMVSANDADEDIVRCLDLGAHDYVTKPFIYPVLSARMRSAIRLKHSQEALAAANANLAQMAAQDPLTQANNRRHFMALAYAEFAKARRFHRPLSLMMIDADHFKQLNDEYGHSMGDEALKLLAGLCRTNVRESDIFGRLGGEEFAICCPESNLSGVAVVAERIREAVATTTISSDNKTASFTLSIGVTQMLEQDDSFETILKRADKLLYQAKTDGRNRVIVA